MHIFRAPIYVFSHQNQVLHLRNLTFLVSMDYMKQIVFSDKIHINLNFHGTMTMTRCQVMCARAIRVLYMSRTIGQRVKPYK